LSNAALVRDNGIFDSPAGFATGRGADVVAAVRRFSSGTVIGSSRATMAARWSSNHGGSSSAVPSAYGASSW
jgi:hypothetical protein